MKSTASGSSLGYRKYLRNDLDSKIHLEISASEYLPQRETAMADSQDSILDSVLHGNLSSIPDPPSRVLKMMVISSKTVNSFYQSGNISLRMEENRDTCYANGMNDVTEATVSQLI
ncbi:hypothetical protein CEXT_105561 [Caerostris extrusa]|uniref:Uncharacterized protein n=1 Tax=Caerostris extrusa TaxID=172846 RepID=A0AAV4R0W8_CAEEX|nr:hypothetical protein CEXT_105561 [Caerostris extrusa]